MGPWASPRLGDRWFGYGRRGRRGSRHPERDAVDLSVGQARWPFTLEKRYVDVLAPDGTVLLVYLGWLSLGGLRLRRVTADLFQPGAVARRGSAVTGRARGGEGWADFGAARIDGENLSFETIGLSARLTIRPRHPPSSPRVPLLSLGPHRVEWTVEVPDADAEGEVRWPGGSLRLAGRGYRDRVWMDLPPWRPVLHELEWGRIAAAGHASTWLRLEAAGQRISAGWIDGRSAPAEACQGSLRDQRLLVQGRVADLEGLGLSLLRPVVRRLARDPHQVKWACTAELLGAPGVAIHELVRWR